VALVQKALVSAQSLSWKSKAKAVKEKSKAKM
jgi:hypothetical protein